MSLALDDKPSLSITRKLKAPPSKVWQAWTDPSHLKRWWGPSDAADTTLAEMDVRVGGRFRIVFEAQDGEEHDVRGEYHEVVTHERLAFTWAWRTTPERESFVTVTLKAVDGGTLMTLKHERFFDEAARDRHNWGWNGALDKLEKSVATIEPVRIEAVPQRIYVGMSVHYDAETRMQIPQQWTRFLPLEESIPHRIVGPGYGIVSGMTVQPFGFEYMTAVEVTQLAFPPAGMTSLTLPPTRYAVFAHEGHAGELPKTLDAIYREWLPGSGYEDSEQGHFLERYGPGFDPVTMQGDVEVWVALKD